MCQVLFEGDDSERRGVYILLPRTKGYSEIHQPLKYHYFMLIGLCIHSDSQNPRPDSLLFLSTESRYHHKSSCPYHQDTQTSLYSHFPANALLVRGKFDICDS